MHIHSGLYAEYVNNVKNVSCLVTFSYELHNLNDSICSIQNGEITFKKLSSLHQCILLCVVFKHNHHKTVVKYEIFSYYILPRMHSFYCKNYGIHTCLQ